MSDFELDPSKLLGQEIRLCVERSRADENEFDEAEEEAIYWLIYDRVRHLGLRKHKMFGHIMLCLMPIAAATDDLDDLDELIQEVAEWLSQFKSLAVMAKLAKINSEFMELRSDGQTDIPADRLKFYQAVQSRSSLFTTLQDSILIFSLERSEEHTSELQSLLRISYAVFCLK